MPGGLGCMAGVRHRLFLTVAVVGPPPVPSTRVKRMEQFSALLLDRIDHLLNAAGGATIAPLSVRERVQAFV